MWIKRLAIYTLTTAIVLTVGSSNAQAANSRPRLANTVAQVLLKNGLPPCTMDSFVHEAYEHAEHIYGDEGTTGPPLWQSLQPLITPSVSDLASQLSRDAP